MAEKRKYQKDGKTFHFKGIVTRMQWLKFKAVAIIRDITLNKALDEAIKDYNDKYKELLG